jgi:hypothetical protein
MFGFLARARLKFQSAIRPVRRRKTFHPTLDGTLEPRVVLSQLPGIFYIKHPQIGYAFANNNPRFLSKNAPPFPRGFNGSKHIAIETAHGGQTARVLINGAAFNLQLTQFISTPTPGATSPTTLQPTVSTNTDTASTTSPVQVAGTIRAYAMPHGLVGIIIDGTNALTELDINPVPFPQRKGYAHSFAYGFSGRSRVLNIGSINVTSGQIGAILGYHTADLYGPLTVDGPGNVDRIAFDALQPGSLIKTGGDVNTLDVFKDANLNGPGTGVSIGRDLNFMNVSGNMTISNGANFFVTRNVGEIAQPAKGTESGLSQASSTLTNNLYAGALIQGNLTVQPGSTFVVSGQLFPGFSNTTTGQIAQPAIFNIRGSLYGANHVTIPGAIFSGPNQNVFVGGSITNT